MRKLFSILILLILINSRASSQDKVMYVNEELNYVVYYGFIKLGEVKFKITGKKNEGEKSVYTAWSSMKSYPGIPFVSLDITFESDMVGSGAEVYSERFKAVEDKDGKIITTEYKFYYDSNFVHVKKINDGKIEKDENIKFNENIKFQDGLSLFYQARFNSFKAESFQIPVFMNEAETSINYFFSAKSEDISLSNFDNDINSVRCSGSANFVGVFGLSGEFAGWFCDDETRIPVKAQMNVMVGNITLELDSYKRSGVRIK